MWPFSVASQTLLRQLDEPAGNVGEVVALLHQVWQVMQQLKDESGNWDSFSERIAQKLSHFGIFVASEAPISHNK